ncbi:MAG: FitA-like ribbon-helix-helix domain-containing protein [Thermoanaerobaculia bacterium]
MNVLIRDLSEKTVKELKKRAFENSRSLQAELKVILDETAERRRHLRKWRKNADRIFNEMKNSGRTFSDSTQLIREDRDR